MTWVLDSTRIKQTFLRPTSDNGTSVPLLATGFRRFCVTAVWGFFLLFGYTCSAAFVHAPKEAVKALKVTKGKPFSHGVVFIDGKFIEPPYVVERYGNVIRINKIQVTNPVVEWSEFMKTQSGVVTRTVEADRPPVPAKEEVSVVPTTVSSDDDGDDPLDDLFEDASAKPKKQAEKSSADRKEDASNRKPKTVMELQGEFEMNAKATMLVSKINAVRTDIDASLRRGCFFCFGSTYSRVCGDKGAANRILQQLPKIMKNNSEFGPFAAEVRKAGFVYFPPNLVKQLFANRVDYIVLQRRWKKVFDELEFNTMLEHAGVQGY